MSSKKPPDNLYTFPSLSPTRKKSYKSNRTFSRTNVKSPKNKVHFNFQIPDLLPKTKNTSIYIYAPSQSHTITV